MDRFLFFFQDEVFEVVCLFLNATKAIQRNSFLWCGRISEMGFPTILPTKVVTAHHKALQADAAHKLWFFQPWLERRAGLPFKTSP